MHEMAFEFRAEIIRIWKETRRRNELYGIVDLGSVKYTSQPAISVSLHWPERKGNEVVLRTMVIGTRSFDSAFYLSNEDQKSLNEKVRGDNSEESST